MMNTNLVGLALAGFLTAASSASAQAVPAPERAEPSRPRVEQSEVDVEELVDQLGAEKFQDRRAAERALRRMGKAAEGALEDAIRHSDDPEVRWRAHRALRALERGEGGMERLQPRGGVPAPAPGSGTEERPAPPWGMDEDVRRRVLEQMERSFGRGGDVRFEELQKQLEDMQRRIDEMMRGMPMPQAFGVPPGGIHGQFQRSGTSIQIRPDGVRVEIEEAGEDGETERKVYEADSLEEFREHHPDLARRFLGDVPHVLRLHLDDAEPWSATEDELRARIHVPMDLEVMEAEGDGPRLGVFVGELSDDVRGFLGVAAGRGLLVDRVVDGSLAAAAGLRAKDVILKVAGRVVASPGDVAEALAAVEPGAKVEVVVNRMGREETLSATTGEESSEVADEPRRLRRIQVR